MVFCGESVTGYAECGAAVDRVNTFSQGTMSQGEGHTGVFGRDAGGSAQVSVVQYRAIGSDIVGELIALIYTGIARGIIIAEFLLHSGAEGNDAEVAPSL